MSTNATILDVTSTDLAVKTENVEFAVYVEHDPIKDKNTVKHTSFASEIEKLQKDEDPNKKIAFIQSVRTYKVGTVAGLAELVPDVEEQVAIINRGLAAKFNQKIKTELTETDEAGGLAFTAVAGFYDSKDLLQEPTQRKNLSETDKALKVLSALPADVRALLLAKFASANAVSTTSYSDSE